MKPTPATFVDRCARVAPQKFKVQAYGFLLGFELWLPNPLPNMDVNTPYELTAGLQLGGINIDVGNVFSVCASVKRKR